MAKNFFSGLFGKKQSTDPEPETPKEKEVDAPQPAAVSPVSPDRASLDAAQPTNDPSAAQPPALEPTAFDKIEKTLQAPTPPSDAPTTEPTPAATPTVTPPVTPPEASPRASDETATPEKSEGATPLPTDEQPKEKKKGWFSRLTEGLSKSSSKLTDGVSAIFTKRKLDDETLEDLHDLLVTADLGVPAATRITEALAKDKFDKEISDREVRDALASEVAATLAPHEAPLAINGAHKPHVILMTGVNGAGKTTTIGKLTRKFKDDGKSVLLAAGDTFRAAAIEQLAVWGERTNTEVVSRDVGADAAGLAFDALKQAQAQNTDILIIDTAGRLQNKTALMDELAKIVRVLKKIDPQAPQDVVLVLDATVGQNAISQAAAFQEIAGVTGIIMTKLDGTARGGVLVALADKFGLPIHYVGVGESVGDLQPFHAESFAKALAGAGSE